MQSRLLLKWLYWLAFVLEGVTLIPWLFTITAGITAIPAGATLALFFVHHQSLRQLKQKGHVRKNYIAWQTGLGILVATCFGLIVFALANLDCIDVCNNPATYWLTDALPLALICWTLASGLAVAPYFLNKRITSK